MTAAHTEVLSDQRGYRKTAGERLRRARELKGFSQKDVANALNLMVSHVRAIESNRYDARKEGEHFGGYLRAYAQLVDLDPQQITDLYLSQSEESGADTVFLSPVQAPPAPQSNFKLGIGIGFSAVVCLAIAIWLVSKLGVFGGGDVAPPELAKLEQGEAVAAAEPADTASEQAAPMSEPEEEAKAGPAPDSQRQSPAPPAVLERTDPPQVASRNDSTAKSPSSAEVQRQSGAGSSPEIESRETGQRLATPADKQQEVMARSRLTPAAAARQRRERLAAQAAAERAANASEATLANIDIQKRAAPTDRQSSRRQNRESDRRAQPQQAAAAQTPASVTGNDQLVLDFTTDCWVEIYDANGTALRLGVERAGDQLILRGKAPFDVLVGFSRGVTMTLNGEPVPIKQHQFSDSTQLVVGGPDDYFGTQLDYDDAGRIDTGEPAIEEELSEFVVEDLVADRQEFADSGDATPQMTEREDRAGDSSATIDGQGEESGTEQTAAADKRVHVPARYSRSFATPAPSTVDELEMAARRINRSPDDDGEASRANDRQSGHNSSTESDQDKLEFTFSAECWVEVYDVEKRPLVMDTKYAGETLELIGQGPFEVRVGNSRAVSLKVNGQKVEIKRDRYIGSTEFFVGSR